MTGREGATEVDTTKIHDVPENVLKLVLQLVEQEMAAQVGQALLPSAKPTVDVKPEEPDVARGYPPDGP